MKERSPLGSDRGQRQNDSKGKKGVGDNAIVQRFKSRGYIVVLRS